MIKINYPVDFYNNYYNSIINATKLASKEISEINTILGRITYKGFPLNLERLVTAKFEELIDLKTCFKNEFENEFRTNVKFKNPGFDNYIDYLFDKRSNKNILEVKCLDKNIKLKINNDVKAELNSILCNNSKIAYEIESIRKKISIFFMLNSSKINLKTCYYCNIDFVNSFIFNKKKSNHFTLDHFLPKDKFPYFSISLFNLVPSCYPCNSKFKRSKEFFYDNNLKYMSPTYLNYSIENELRFDLLFNVVGNDLEEKICNVTNTNDFKVKLNNTSANSSNDDFIKFFQLNGRYDFHIGETFKMIEKRKIYSDSQIEEISKFLISKGIFKDSDSIKKDIFGSSIFNDEENNEPLTKYKKDIARQLGLIK